MKKVKLLFSDGAWALYIDGDQKVTCSCHAHTVFHVLDIISKDLKFDLKSEDHCCGKFPDLIVE